MNEKNMPMVNRMFAYNLWANKTLMQLCQSLDETKLEGDAKEVFGKIHPILMHLVSAEGGYLKRLMGKRPWADDLDWEGMSLRQLEEKVIVSGRLFIEIANQVDLTRRHDVEFDGEPYYFLNWTVLLQAVYHGIEHRTQIKVLLTELGVVHPELAAWDYMESLQ